MGGGVWETFRIALKMKTRKITKNKKKRKKKEKQKKKERSGSPPIESLFLWLLKDVNNVSITGKSDTSL